MTANLDKDDLFRNVLPGYVFLIVILSFYVVTNRLDAIKEAPRVIVAAVAGFPIGFIIQSIYRIVFHFPREEWHMDKKDSIFISRFADGNDIENWFIRNYEDLLNNKKKAIKKLKAKALSNVFLYFLNQNDEKYKERIVFLLSYIHGLGASCLAIFFALGLVTLFKFSLWQKLWWQEESLPAIKDFNFNFIILRLFWLFTAVIFYFGRQRVKKAYTVATRALVWNKQSGIEVYFKQNNTGLSP